MQSLKTSYAVFSLLITIMLLTACQPVTDTRPGQINTLMQQDGGLLEVNGTQLFVKVVGEGEPIIMLHGGPGSEHNFFARYTEALADEYQLIYYDQRSTGSSIPDTDPKHYTTDTFVDDLDGIRQALDLEQVSLLGWSWGGDLAMLYAIKYPQHLKSIVLVDPGNVSPEFDEAFNENFGKRASEEELAALDVAYQKLDTEKTGDAYEEFARHLLPIYMADKSMINGLEIVIPDNSAIYGNAVAAGLWTDLADFDFLGALAEITTPTLIIHGDEDLIPLASSEQIHAAIAGSQLVVLEGIGHIPFVEAPEQFFAAVRAFMQEVSQ